MTLSCRQVAAYTGCGTWSRHTISGLLIGKSPQILANGALGILGRPEVPGGEVATDWIQVLPLFPRPEGRGRHERRRRCGDWTGPSRKGRTRRLRGRVGLGLCFPSRPRGFPAPGRILGRSQAGGCFGFRGFFFAVRGEAVPT